MDRDLVVTVLFDFEYHSSDGQRVHMHKDEEFLVIQQTNSDWWQVIRSGERKPFYAPTQYLKVQPRPRPQLPPKVKPVKRNARDSRRAPLSITDAERHISCEDDAPGDETPGRRRCNSLEDAAAGSSSVETLDDSPPAPVSRPAPGGTPQATELHAAAGGQADTTPGRGATPRLPPSRHRRPRISKDLWARRKSWSVDERSRTWELVRPEAAPAPAAATSTASLDGRHRAPPDKRPDKKASAAAAADRSRAGAEQDAVPSAEPSAEAVAATAAVAGSAVGTVTESVTETTAAVKAERVAATATAPDTSAVTVPSVAAVTEPGPGPKTVIGVRAEPGVGTDPRPPRPAERPVPTPRPTVEGAERRPALPSAVNKPPPPPVPVPVTAVPAASVRDAADSSASDGRTGVSGVAPRPAGESGSDVGQRRTSTGGVDGLEPVRAAAVSADSAGASRANLESVRPESRQRATEERVRRPAPRRIEAPSVDSSSKANRAVTEPPQSTDSGRVTGASANPSARVSGGAAAGSDSYRVAGESAEGSGQRRVSIESAGARRVPVDSVEVTAPRQPAGSITEAAGPKREHGRFKQEVLKLISRSRRSEERRSSDGAPSRSRPTADFWDRSGPRQQDGRPAPPPAAQKRPTTLERETVTSGDRSAPISGVIMKSASVELTRTVAGPVEQAVAAERAERGPRPDVLPSADGAESPPGLHRQTSYDRTLQSFSTFSNLRSARIDLAGHNASFKRTAERLRRPPDREAERARRPTAGRQVEPPRVDGPPRPPVPPKTLQLRLQPAADGLPTTPDDGDWSDSEPAGSESESGSWERLDQMKAALYFANPLMPRSGLSRSADHLPVPLPRTRLTEISPPQSRQPPPVPHILETPIRSLHDGWGEYLHHGRKYYYNVDTQSSTWKPPRRNVKSPATSPDKSVSDPSRPTAEAGTPVLEVDVPLVPLPPGWRRRVDSTGELCYVRDSSPTRWYSNQNEDDHVYFFKEGSNSSTWTLPSAENGASQMARDTSVSVLQESVSPRPVPVGGVPSVLQVARGQRGRSLVYPPAPTTEPPPPQLVSGNQTHTILNQGTLNHTRLAKETSWRARKSWAPCRVVLTDRSLFLFKDTRSNAGMPPHWGKAGLRPDTNVDLAGAFVDWEREASSRKNVFQIRTVSGLRLLLQDDDALTANHWFDAIKRAIAGVPCSTNQLPVPRHVTADDRLTRSRSVRFTAGPESQEDLSRDNSTIKDRLRRFFRARPPADSLVSRGILKDEPVFGGHLAALCTVEDSTVPRFVTECIAAIEAKPEHLRMDGVYRASGNLSQVQRIRCEVDQDNYQVLYDEEDVHVLTGALKLFFRELKEPLIPFAVLPEALRAAGLTAKPDQVAAFRRMVVALPPPNRDTLATLLAHLNRVTELQEFNRMHAHNLAIVFGPTLMWAEQESPDLALDLMRQNRVVEALLELRTEVFDSP
ncbi:rho GTPase-activating protein 27-like isoform X1 [Amphibalanus amphitrite]|uniref:rho GTPase-activating protein 27-like isoform X1 n=1 Tax=Amphibalanus amphitrite TaxID=1232801 RepID=UPI001C927E0F|nr:rho GTPase-activating protein 27-like isoform X1 [Amphibalanus amphitrite]